MTRDEAEDVQLMYLLTRNMNNLYGTRDRDHAETILASDWLAARDAEQRRLGAEAVVAAVLSDAPRLNAELRHDGTSEPGMAAYIEGWRDAYAAARAAARQVSER